MPNTNIAPWQGGIGNESHAQKPSISTRPLQGRVFVRATRIEGPRCQAFLTVYSLGAFT